MQDGGKLGAFQSRRGGAGQRTGSGEGVRVGATRAGLWRRQRGALLLREGVPPRSYGMAGLRWRGGMRKAFECESLAQGHLHRAGRAGLNVTCRQRGQNGPLGLASVPQVGTPAREGRTEHQRHGLGLRVWAHGANVPGFKSQHRIPHPKEKK